MRTWAIPTRCLVALTVLASLLTASGARAAIVDLATPAGVAPGEQFRFIFVTSATTTALSGDASTYNAFVDGLGDAALTYNGSSVNWLALVSTAGGQSATDIVPNNDDDIPIYMVTGELLALTGEDLWDGSVAAELDTTELLTHNSDFAWTGTQSNGSGDGDYRLGQSGLARIGATGDADFQWIMFALSPSDNFRSIYAVSEVLTASSATVPEPTSLAILAMAGFGVLGGRSFRRRKVG